MESLRVGAGPVCVVESEGERVTLCDAEVVRETPNEVDNVRETPNEVDNVSDVDAVNDTESVFCRVCDMDDEVVCERELLLESVPLKEDEVVRVPVMVKEAEGVIGKVSVPPSPLRML